MDLPQLLESAIQKAGGVTALADALRWDKGTIAGVRGRRSALSPYWAAQLAIYVGAHVDEAIYTALMRQAPTAREEDFWANCLRPNIPEVREIVSQEIGSEYVFVVASAIDRLRADKPLSRPEVREASRRAKGLFDANAAFFRSDSPRRVPIGARREIMARYLAGESVEHLISELNA